MRKFIAITASIIALASCSNDKIASQGKEAEGRSLDEAMYTPSKSAHHVDSAMTVARYVLGTSGRVDEQMVKRFIKDTVIRKVDSTGNGNFKVTNTVGKDTVYRIPLFDTLRVNGKPVYDSAKKVKLQLYYYDLPARWVLIDYNKSF
jgi:hypothetical protein